MDICDVGLQSVYRIRRCGGQLSLMLVLAFLGGCGFAGLKPQSRIIDAPDVEQTLTASGVPLSPAAWPTTDWWHSFKDTQLDSLVSEALATSPTLRSAATRVQQAAALEAIQGASLLPEADVKMSTTRERFSANGTTPSPVKGTWQNIDQATFNVGYELDFWGKNRSAVEAAVGRRHAIEVDAHAATLMLSAAVVQAYIRLANTYQQLDVAQALLSQQQQIEKLTQQRFAAELDTQIDIKQSQASLMGKGPNRGRNIARPQLQPSDTLELPTRIAAELVGHRPDVVAQRWRVEASSHDIDIAKARFYPDVNLTSFIGLQSLAFGTFNDRNSRIFALAEGAPRRAKRSRSHSSGRSGSCEQTL